MGENDRRQIGKIEGSIMIELWTWSCYSSINVFANLLHPALPARRCLPRRNRGITVRGRSVWQDYFVHSCGFQRRLPNSEKQRARAS